MYDRTPASVFRQRLGWSIVAGTVGMALWVAFPGFPVLGRPTADPETIAMGRVLFEHQWQPNDPLAAEGGDGLGPVYNARSCADCHFQGGVGGAGPRKMNVQAYLVHPTTGEPQVHSGVVHAYAVHPTFQETPAVVRRMYPIIPGRVRVTPGCTYIIPSFDRLRFESINTPALFGSGWIDQISTKSIVHNARRRVVETISDELNSNFDGVTGARVPRLPDGRIGKFGWRGQFATLEEFVAAACANEIGLGTPVRAQTAPLTSTYPDKQPDLDESQFRAMVAFVATLPRPVQKWPMDPVQRSRAHRGERLFHEVGCQQCHTPDIGGVAGIYTDFMLYRIDDRHGSGYGIAKSQSDEPWPSDVPRPNEWQTPPLWGVADSAPYFHDGMSPDLHDAIERHGGQARNVSERYLERSQRDQEDLIAFLSTLKAPHKESPGSDSAGVAR